MIVKRILPLAVLILSLIVTATLEAQVPVKVSNEKLVSGGKVYYMHEVLKGQTLYSISRAYKVKISDITALNVIPSSGIQAGQVLRIPAGEPAAGAVSGPSSTEQAVPMPKQRLAESTPPGGAPSMNIEISDEKIVSNNKVYYMHQVLKGQTLYSIAKAYKVTILDIDRENVIPPSGIRAGQVLKIPASSSLKVTKETTMPQVENKPGVATSQAASAASKTAKAQSPMPHQENAATTAKLPRQEMPHQENAATTTQLPRQEMPHQEKPAETLQEAAQPDKNVSQKDEDVTPPVKETPETRTVQQQEDNPVSKTAQQDEPEQDSYKRIVHKVRKGESLSEIADKYGVTVQDIRKSNKGVIFAMPDMRLVILVKEEPENK
jgi:LysM repeat protein